MIVFTQHTYNRSSSALNLKLSMPDRIDEVIAWGSVEKYFNTGSFKSDAPGFFESAVIKFDLLALCTFAISFG